MYPVSELYKSKIKELERTFEAKIQIQHSQGVLDLTDSDIVQGTLSYTESSQAGEDFTIGGTVASNIEFSIFNKPEYINYDFIGATVTVNIGLKIDTGFEYVPLGVFNVDDVGKQRNTIKLKAIDNMIKLDKPYSLSNLGYPATLFQIYVDACNVCDIMPAMGSFTNSNYVVQEHPGDDLTFRDIIGYIAELSGSFARMNRTGALEFAWYTETGLTLTSANRFNFIPRDDLVQIKGVMATVDDTTYLAGTDEYAIDLSENPLLQGDHETILPVIYDKIKDVAFYPFESSWQGNPAIQAGDIIKQIDRDNKEWPTIVTSSTYKYRGASTLAAKGLPIIAKGFKGSTNRKIAEIKRRIEKEIGDKLTTLEQVQLHNTELIANMLGGHLITDEEGALYIADNPDLDQAVKVWKWGIGGFGYSSTGKDGPYTTSISADGSIVAMLVAANIITADMVQTGELRSVDGSTRINLDDGSFNFKDALIWDNNKLTVKSPDLNPFGVVNDEHVIAYFPFDGSLTATNGIQPTFTRNSEAYTSDGAKVGIDSPRFEQGKFGQGVMVEEGTENLLTENQASAETDITGFRTTRSTLVQSSEKKWHGNYSIEVTATDNNPATRVEYPISGIDEGTPFAFSCKVWGIVGKRIRLNLEVTGGENPNASIGSIALEYNGEDPLHISCTGLVDYADRQTLRCWVYAPDHVAGEKFYVDGLQLEQKSYATSWQLPTVARVGDNLSIPLSLSSEEGTIEFFCGETIHQVDSPARRRGIVKIGNTLGGHIGMSIERDLLGTYRIVTRDNVAGLGSSVLNLGDVSGPVHIAATWKDGVVYGYLNGQLIGTAPNNWINQTSAVFIGNGGIEGNSTNQRWMNAYIDDLRISSIARTDEEIKAYYESKKPFYDHNVLVRQGYSYNNVTITAERGVVATHPITGGYTQLNTEGLRRFVPTPIFEEQPIGEPNFEGFESGELPEGWTTTLGGNVISSDKRSGDYCLQLNRSVYYSSQWGTIEAYNVLVTSKYITTQTQMSFWYKSLGTSYFYLDGTKYSLSASTSWKQFTINVSEGYHVFSWEAAVRENENDYGLRLDDVMFEENPLERVIVGYETHGYEYGYRVYIGTAATLGTFSSPTMSLISDIWIQLPGDFMGKDFKIFLSLKSARLLGDRVDLEVMEIDYEKAAVKVRARALASWVWYELYYLMDYVLWSGTEYSVSGVEFTYMATY